MSHRIKRVLLAGLGLSCGSTPTVPPAPENAMDPSIVRFEAKSPEDLDLPLQIAWEKAQRGGTNTTFEVALPAGSLTGTSLSLLDRSGRMSITLRGRSGEPTVLDDLPVRLGGADVRLENLVFRGGRRVAPLVHVSIARSLVVEGVSFLDNQRLEREEATMIRVVSSFRTGGKPILIRNGWFIGNHLEGEGSLLLLETDTPDFVTQAVFDNVAFLENTTNPVLAPGSTHDLRFRDCTVVARPEAGPFLLASTPTMQVTFEGGLLGLPSLDRIVRRDSTPPTAPEAWPLVRLKDTRLYAGGTAMAGLALEGTTPLPAAHLAAGGDACRREALAGSVPDVGWIARAYGIGE
jgi:hypothetical protein